MPGGSIQDTIDGGARAIQLREGVYPVTIADLVVSAKGRAQVGTDIDIVGTAGNFEQGPGQRRPEHVLIVHRRHRGPGGLIDDRR